MGAAASLHGFSETLDRIKKAADKPDRAQDYFTHTPLPASSPYGTAVDFDYTACRAELIGLRADLRRALEIVEDKGDKHAVGLKVSARAALLISLDRRYQIDPTGEELRATRPAQDRRTSSFVNPSRCFRSNLVTTVHSSCSHAWSAARSRCASLSRTTRRSRRRPSRR